MKLDRTKLKAAIKQAESSTTKRWTWEQRKTLRCGHVKISPRWTWTASECQILYAIAAQARGRLSIQKKWAPLCDSTGGRQLVEFTQEMQAELIGDAWKEFTREEPTLVPVEELAKVSA
jgi:hypothetical protein